MAERAPRFLRLPRGGYELAIEGIREAVKQGFRVTTNTTLFDGADRKRARVFRRNDGAGR